MLTRSALGTFLHAIETQLSLIPSFRIFPTKMTAFALKNAGETKVLEGQPMGRVGRPSDLAGLALFLTSPASAHVTGAHILLDGGGSLSRQGIAPQVKL